jgi:hypothetical protein
MANRRDLLRQNAVAFEFSNDSYTPLLTSPQMKKALEKIGEQTAKNAREIYGATSVAEHAGYPESIRVTVETDNENRMHPGRLRAHVASDHDDALVVEFLTAEAPLGNGLLATEEFFDG